MSTDRDDFSAFYESAKDDCLRAVLVSVGRPDVAEDLVAEAFARAWSRWPKVRRHPAPRAWVVRTALNASVTAWRRQRRDTDPSTWHLPPAQADPADVCEQSLLVERLMQLPARQREVVALRVFLDLDTLETARVLGIAPGTVTAHLARAVAALRRQLATTKERDTR